MAAAGRASLGGAYGVWVGEAFGNGCAVGASGHTATGRYDADRRRLCRNSAHDPNLAERGTHWWGVRCVKKWHQILPPLLIGLAGLVLPVLQGWLFLAISALLFSMYPPGLRSWIDRHTIKYPKIHAFVGKAQAWTVKVIGAPEA